MIDQYLLQVRKPGRYIASEWNVIKKDPKVCDIKFALCFPDIYELGMSYLGLRILYGFLNERTNICCERVFAPAGDFEKVLRDNKIPLFSLENRIPLKEFDILGFSLTYELNYTNVLNMLDLAGIPVFSKDRSSNYPLVIAGGNCTLNPEPMADFFDLFLIGDAEEAILEIADVYKNNKDKNKEDLLKELSSIEGVYVPCLSHKSVIKKRIVNDLNAAYFPKSWIVPYIEIVHDRLSLEVARGCPHQCRFCQARVYYWPYRERRVDLLLEQAKNLYKNTGYEEISLMALSSSNYSKLECLVESLYSFCNDNKIALSFPSVRPNMVVSKMGSILSKIRKTTITFAPEAANCALRGLLNKNLKTEELVQSARELFSCGYSHIKLYFMIGLPGETEEDLDRIIELCQELLNLKKETANKRIFLNISISNFIPKPHTVFQWLAFEDINKLKEKQGHLKSKFKKFSRDVKVSFHDVRVSFLEALLTRSDNAFSMVIYYAWRFGAKFDGWGDQFNFSLWEKAFLETGIDASRYLNKQDLEKNLPWDFIDTGISKDKLIEDYNKTFNN